MSVFEKTEVLRNIWLSAHLFNQIKMLTFLKISANFHNTCRWRDSVSVHLVLSNYSNSSPCHSPRHSLFQLFLSIRTNFLECTTWKVSRYGVFSCPYFPVFRLNTEIYSKSPYSVPIQENTDQKDSVFRHAVTISFNHKALITFHHDPPNNHASGPLSCW